ncbi:Protein FAR1-RELATED SEQUENCE [Psidium guajava]|nr:Protein FAR1-RELATED SEQUENCE [Psidium guajava]
MVHHFLPGNLKLLNANNVTVLSSVYLAVNDLHLLLLCEAGEALYSHVSYGHQSTTRSHDVPTLGNCSRDLKS